MAILAILTTIFKGDGRQGCHKGAHQVHRSRCSDIDTCSRYNDPARQYSNLPTPAPEGAGAELMPRQRIKFYWEARREIWATARSVSTLRGFLPPSQSPHPPPAPVVLYTPRYIRPNGLAQSKFSALQARRCYIGVVMVVVVVVGGGQGTVRLAPRRGFAHARSTQRGSFPSLSASASVDYAVPFIICFPGQRDRRAALTASDIQASSRKQSSHGCRGV